MTTIIVGTNRAGNEAQKFAPVVQELLAALGEESQVLRMEDVPAEVLHAGMYEKDGQTPAIRALQDQYITAAERMVFIVPEYNGSYPGVLKLFLDAVSVRDYKLNFKRKPMALIGVSTGRAGNLRGLDHLTGSLMHMGGYVVPNRLPISNIKSLMNAEGAVSDAKTIEALRGLMEDLVGY